MKFLEVQDDGSLVEESELELGTEKVLIIVNEETKRLWLWKGVNCPIRKKFVGSRALSDLRKNEYGFAYIPQSCDQNDETSEFVVMLEKIGKTDLISPEVLSKVREIRDRQKDINIFNETDIEPSPSMPKPPSPTPAVEEGDSRLKDRPAQVPQSQLPNHLAKMGAPGNRPMPTILTALESDVVDSPKSQTIVEELPDQTKESFKILRDLGAPSGFYRDLVIIGTKVYTESYDNKFEELDEPPEGIFFSKDHVPRMICEKGIVRSIEFLKPEEGAELSEEDKKISQDINDLIAMFEIEIG
ncbi:MAG: hypothetical protein KAS95_01505 [Candidatus Heimdallarchaeota archaeon]|nr:hypothetical protein [Candidatus Heimdallarchaeota archaeon]